MQNIKNLWYKSLQRNDFFLNRFAKNALTNAEKPAMTDISNIFKTKLVNKGSDVFWSENQDFGEVQPKATLIITTPLTESSNESIQLGKILSACTLDSNSYNHLQLTENEQIAWHKIKQAYQPKTIILFGIHPNELGVLALFRLNDINNFDNVKWIPTLSLEKLEQTPEAKKLLWQDALKPLFADK